MNPMPFRALGPQPIRPVRFGERGSGPFASVQVTSTSSCRRSNIVRRSPSTFGRRSVKDRRPSLSDLVATVVIVIEPSIVPQDGRVVLVLLKDRRQLEGELIVLTNCYFLAGVVFEAWEIETLEESPDASRSKSSLLSRSRSSGFSVVVSVVSRGGRSSTLVAGPGVAFPKSRLSGCDAGHAGL